MTALLLSLALAQECPDATSTLNDAVDQLILLNEEALAADLEQVEASFSCDWLDPDALAMWWLLKGAQHQLAGNDKATREAFVMAQAIAPDLWLDVLGAPLRTIYDEERAKDRPRGKLDLTNTGNATVRIDGKVRSLPVALVPGTHLLQIGSGDTVDERRDVVIVAGQGAVLDLGRTAAAVDGGAPLVTVSLWGATGFGFASGEALKSSGLSEPATKLAIPFEAGALVGLGAAWVRVQGGYAPLLGGQLLYLLDGEVAGSKGFMPLGAAVGASFAGFHAGALGLVVIPSRTGLRGLVGRDIVGPLGVEFRGGINLHPERSAEPAVELLVRVQPSIF